MAVVITGPVDGDAVNQAKDNLTKDSTQTAFNAVLGGTEAYTAMLMAEQGSTPSTPSTNQWKTYTTAGGLWLLDDGGVASNISNGVALIPRTALGSNSTTLDITGIPATYAHLELWLDAISTNAVALPSSATNLRFNNDTGSNYHYGAVLLDDTYTYVRSVTGSPVGSIIMQQAVSSVGETPSAVRIRIMNYASTTSRRSVLYQASNITTSRPSGSVGGGAWLNNSAAISTINLSFSGQFAAATAYSLYAYR